MMPKPIFFYSPPRDRRVAADLRTSKLLASCSFLSTLSCAVLAPVLLLTSLVGCGPIQREVTTPDAVGAAASETGVADDETGVADDATGVADDETVPLRGPSPMTVEALPIPFHAEAPGVHTTGGVKCAAAFELRSPAVRFGGFSGMEIEGDRILAISDRGHWWTSPLLFSQEGHLQGFGPGIMGPIAHVDGEPVDGREEHDAEDLISWPGGYVVSYEVDHRLHFHRHPELPTPIDGAADGRIDGLSEDVERWNAPAALAEVEENEGLEAIVRLEDGRMLIFAEHDEGEGEHRVFVGRPDESDAWDSLSVRLPPGLHPTAAARLPSGEVLLLERGWNPEEGVKIRLSKIRSEFRGGERLRAEELALLRPPLAVDNMEAMDVEVDPDGRVWIYLLSDDNYSETQRTLFLQLELIRRADA